MKAETVCPKCGKKVIETCEACIASDTLIHKHGNGTDFFENVKWNIIEFAPKDEKVFDSFKKFYKTSTSHKKHD